MMHYMKVVRYINFIFLNILLLFLFLGKPEYELQWISNRLSNSIKNTEYLNNICIHTKDKLLQSYSQLDLSR